ncbi:MAG: permease-like cell division protein FtsX [Bacteroidetes bacterium]|nr:permease-like cell division protein FtsX [Bacteroidota bacterium]
MSYIFKSAIQSLYREKWINLLSMFAIASSLFIILITFLLVYNFHIATNRLPELFSIVIYLEDAASKEETEKIITQLKQRNDISSVSYFSKADALTEFKKTVKGAGAILEGLDENPLSSYVEIKLKKDYVTLPNIKTISEDIRKIHGVEDVYFGEKIAETINFLRKSFQGIGIFLFFIISVVVIFISYSTVKILFYRKKEELEIMRLLGATSGFIRAPFVLEGGVLGLIGGIIGATGVVAIYLLIKIKISTFVPIFESIIMPWIILPISLLTGLLLGIIGSLIAIGRLRA